jgi:hypothetical protein
MFKYIFTDHIRKEFGYIEKIVETCQQVQQKIIRRNLTAMLM